VSSAPCVPTCRRVETEPSVRVEDASCSVSGGNSTTVVPRPGDGTARLRERILAALASPGSERAIRKLSYLSILHYRRSYRSLTPRFHMLSIGISLGISSCVEPLESRTARIACPRRPTPATTSCRCSPRPVSVLSAQPRCVRSGTRSSSRSQTMSNGGSAVSRCRHTRPGFHPVLVRNWA
jgi:hypothetical protein